jgi:pyruvate formate lyase activating enzyme
VTRFFPAYKLSHIPETPENVLFEARAQAERAGLHRVYVYNDKGCDCAAENKPIEVYLNGTAEELHQVKQCAASCCGDKGILLKKYE